MLSSRFQPNEDDIVRIHLPVHGVEERLVQTPEALPIRVCDVANSQRNVSVWSRFFEDGMLHLWPASHNLMNTGLFSGLHHLLHRYIELRCSGR